jgi:hypothetical protein
MTHMTDLELAKSFAPDNAPSFLDVIGFVERNEGLKPTRRRDLVSGLRLLASAIGETPETCLADTVWLRPRIDKVRPAALGISGKSWTNTISNVRSALAMTGIIERKRGTNMPLSPVWQELWDKVRANGDDNIRLPLSRFPAFCSRIGVAPEEVTDEAVKRSPGRSRTPGTARSNALRAGRSGTATTVCRLMRSRPRSRTISQNCASACRART